MKPKMSVDTKSIAAAFAAIDFNANDLLQIEGAGAYTLVNGMRRRVPVDTSATQNSIKPHIESADENRVIDEVGPETNYAPFIEYGVASKPNYPIQPFVRPAAQEDMGKVVSAIGHTFGQMVVDRWPK